METAMTSAAVKAARASSVSVQQMPLSFLKEGESAHVVKVRGRGDLQHHLENLGFVEGAEVKVVSGVAGDLIVSGKGAQVASGRPAAAGRARARAPPSPARSTCPPSSPRCR